MKTVQQDSLRKSFIFENNNSDKFQEKSDFFANEIKIIQKLEKENS